MIGVGISEVEPADPVVDEVLVVLEVHGGQQGDLGLLELVHLGLLATFFELLEPGCLFLLAVGFGQ